MPAFSWRLLIHLDLSFQMPIKFDMGEFVNRRQKDALEIYCRDAEEDDGSMMLTTFGDSPWPDGMPKIPECVRRDRQ